MLRLNNKPIISLCLFSFFALTVCGQDSPVFRADTRLVVLHASVVDRSGKLVTDLPQKAFQVYRERRRAADQRSSGARTFRFRSAW